jgi:hypothetical protein
MFGNYFYHEHIKRTVAVFGTLFNNLKVVKRDSTGKIISTIKVPLSYGPRQKFLARIADEANLNDPKLAIRLPRMSFEIVSLTYDTGTKLQKGLTSKTPSPSSNPLQRQSILYPTTYKIAIQLNIMSKTQDDALQLIEQIIPHFQPDYTVTVKEVDNNFLGDIPFVIQAITMTDDYEGDFNSRRAIIYTLEFETRVRFYGPLSSRNVIKTSEVTLSNPDMQREGVPYSNLEFTVTPKNATKDEEYEIVGNYNIFDSSDEVKLKYSNRVGGSFVVGDYLRGLTSMSSGKITEVTNKYIVVAFPDSAYDIGETISNTDDEVSAKIDSIEPLYRTY